MDGDDAQNRGLFGSDSDEDAPSEAPPRSSAPPSSDTAAGIVGDDPDLEDDLEDGTAANGDGSSSAQADTGVADDQEGSDNDEAAAPAPGPPQYLNAPLLPVPAAGSISLLKMTNIVGIEPRPFSRETYEDEGDVYVDEQGKNRVKLKDQCCMRWRITQDEHGQESRESNARFVRWSDGSLQLLMGEEVLDVVQQDVAKQNAYLFAVGQVIQGQAALTTRLAFQPASLQSKLHQRLSEVVDKRHTKTQKVARMVGLDNPEMDLLKREKLEEDKIKNRRQLQRKSGRVMTKSGYDAPPRQRPTGLNTNYLEQDDAFEGEEDDFIDDDDDDGRGGSQHGRGGRGGGSSLRRPQMDDEEAEEAAARRLSSAKRQAPAGAGRSGGKKQRKQQDSDEEEEADDDSSEGGEEVEDDSDSDKRAKQVKARRGVVLSDEDDD